jgi:hypothetical protein
MWLPVFYFPYIPASLALRLLSPPSSRTFVWPVRSETIAVRCWPPFWLARFTFAFAFAFAFTFAFAFAFARLLHFPGGRCWAVAGDCLPACLPALRPPRRRRARHAGSLGLLDGFSKASITSFHRISMHGSQIGLRSCPQSQRRASDRPASPPLLKISPAQINSAQLCSTQLILLTHLLTTHHSLLTSHHSPLAPHPAQPSPAQPSPALPCSTHAALL